MKADMPLLLLLVSSLSLAYADDAFTAKYCVACHDAKAKAGFDGLAYSHRKEYARWIGEAKKEETRERRVAKALEMLREGKPPR